ncbi:MAG: glycosyltransferase [Candidatus Asgardarchaeum sp.]
MENISVVSVVHPSSIKFLDSYLNSMMKQTFSDFKLILFGHGVNKDDISSKLDRYDTLDVIFKQVRKDLTIPKVREFITEYIKKTDSDICIFTDSDDFVDENFVKLLSEELIKGGYKVVFSDVTLYYEKTKRVIYNYFSGLIPDEVDLKFILEKNCLGFGNTGISLDIIDENISFPDDIIAVDWWFFTRILYKGLTAKFVPRTFIYYRLYEDNIAGFSNLNKERIIHGANVKRIHYKNLLDLGQQFIILYEEYNCLYKKLESDKSFEKRYVNYILNKYKQSRYLWWEPIERVRWLECQEK